MAPKPQFILKKTLFGAEVRWLDAVSKRLSDPRAILKKIGFFIVAQTLQSFANQGLPANPSGKSVTQTRATRSSTLPGW